MDIAVLLELLICNTRMREVPGDFHLLPKDKKRGLHMAKIEISCIDNTLCMKYRESKPMAALRLVGLTAAHRQLSLLRQINDLSQASKLKYKHTPDRQVSHV